MSKLNYNVDLKCILYYLITIKPNKFTFIYIGVLSAIICLSKFLLYTPISTIISAYIVEIPLFWNQIL